MHISVQMAGKTWGGYPFSKAEISVDYSNNPEINYDGDRTLRYGYFLTAWVGKSAPADLNISSHERRSISKGQVLEHYHAEILADQYYALFDQDGWFDCLVDCMRWCREKGLEKLQANGWKPDEIRLTLRQQDTLENKQPWSYIQINKEVAKWLGEALLEFAEQEVGPDYVAKLTVGHETSVSKTAIDETGPVEQSDMPSSKNGPGVLMFPLDRLKKRS